MEVGVGAGVAVGSRVGVGVGSGVGVSVKVGLGVGVAVDVRVGVEVGVGLAVVVGSGVAVGGAIAATVIVGAGGMDVGVGCSHPNANATKPSSKTAAGPATTPLQANLPILCIHVNYPTNSATACFTRLFAITTL